MSTFLDLLKSTVEKKKERKEKKLRKREQKIHQRISTVESTVEKPVQKFVKNINEIKREVLETIVFLLTGRTMRTSKLNLIREIKRACEELEKQLS